MMLLLSVNFIFVEYNMTVIKDSPLDVAIIFGMDMSARIAEHCFYLIENNGMLFYVLLVFCISLIYM